ncbi:MAG: glycosyltransferase family 2 protein [Bacteroides sp.]|nr:glycosyltransferase family 2 protein [Bacteroides sp.]
MTPKQPLISIVVPIYNVAPYVSRFIESLSTACAQTDAGNLDIIIVNDGSTDDSMNIVNDFLNKDRVLKPITSIINKPNGGLSSARNVGIEHSSGVWIMTLDSDDFISPDYIVKFIEATSMADHDISIIAGGHTLWWSDDNTVARPIDMSTGYDATIMSMSMFSCTKLFRKSAIESYDLKYDSSNLGGEDAQFLFEYWSTVNGRVLPVDTTGYYYRQRQGSLSKSQHIDYIGKLHTYRVFRQAILNCVANNQLSPRLWKHWRKMLGCDLYDMIGDLRLSADTRGKVTEILARDFTSEQIDDLKSFECSKIRRILNKWLIFSVKNRQ